MLQIYFSVRHTIRPHSIVRVRTWEQPSTARRSFRRARCGARRASVHRSIPASRRLPLAHCHQHQGLNRTFYPAEDHHQDYLTRNPTSPYIVFNDLPKIDNLKRLQSDVYRAEPVLVMTANPHD